MSRAAAGTGATDEEIQPVERGRPPRRAAPHAPDADTAITYRYLQFDTPLPAANVTIVSSTTAPRPHPCPPPPPPPPDLRPFVNPVLWPAYRKNVMLVLSCVATFLTAYTAGAYAPPIPLMRADLRGAPSDLALRTGITTFCLGFALAPMMLAPLSEINGRYPVFAVSGVIFVVFQAVCGVVPDLAGMLVARLLVGVGGSVFSTMVGGVIADLWDKEERNTPMALFSGAVLVGTGAGPLVAAVITQRLADRGRGDAALWKWVFWHQVLLGGALVLALVFFFKESRGSVVLSRKARAVNGWYEELEKAGYYGVWVEEEEKKERGEVEKGGQGGGGSSAQQSDSDRTLAAGQTSGDDGLAPAEMDKAEAEKRRRSSSSARPAGVVDSRRNSSVTSLRLVRLRWRVKEDEERSSIGRMISISMYRPFHLLVTEPVVFFFSLWVAFAWAVLYLTFGSIPLVFRRQYGWGVEKSGRVFVAMMVGSVVATAIGLWQEHILHHPSWKTDDRADAYDGSHDNNNSSSSSRRRAPQSRFWALVQRRFPADAPESRLYFTCVTATLLPVGLFLFGFAARPDVHWAVPSLAIGLATVGIYSVYLAVFNYFADTYHRYASSALAAQSFCRNVLGGVFPLVTTPLFTNLGEARAGALLGGVAAGLTVVPWVLVFYGERIRARSRFARQLEGS